MHYSYLLFAYGTVSSKSNRMMIRLSEREIDSNYLKEYNAILQVESRASVQLVRWTNNSAKTIYNKNLTER